MTDSNMSKHDTQSPGDSEAIDRQLQERQEQMAHVDDAPNRSIPNEAMHPQNETTPNDARRNDQRLAGESPQMTGTKSKGRDDLATHAGPQPS